MKNIITQKINEDEVYLKKGKYGYRVVYPHRDSNGKLIWWNVLFGGKSNAARLLIYLVLIVLFYIGIKDLISQYEVIAANPCDYCIDWFARNTNTLTNALP